MDTTAAAMRFTWRGGSPRPRVRSTNRQKLKGRIFFMASQIPLQTISDDFNQRFSRFASVAFFILLLTAGILNINALLLQSLHLLRLLYDFGAVGSQCKTLQIVYNSVVCIIDESYVVLSCCSLCFRAARFVVAAVAPCHFMYARYVQQFYYSGLIHNQTPALCLASNSKIQSAATDRNFITTCEEKRKQRRTRGMDLSRRWMSLCHYLYTLGLRKDGASRVQQTQIFICGIWTRSSSDRMNGSAATLCKHANVYMQCIDTQQQPAHVKHNQSHIMRISLLLISSANALTPPPSSFHPPLFNLSVVSAEVSLPDGSIGRQTRHMANPRCSLQIFDRVIANFLRVCASRIILPPSPIVLR
ncbi:hypothetical protein F2P81_009884 [Scophthalmus maximus]|uniref:Uncharacterized protein n=1 Tax=Scophthalmus maximus TaxID=52904 RepID=A0A6A4SYV9_SCOMX|nr:hypothetical protein F2P81_009884 [Scophthalmus maximus]